MSLRRVGFLAALSAAFTLVPGAALAEPTVKLNGFVDSSLSYTFTPKALADQGVRLGLDEVELDVEVDVGGGLRIRSDLNFFPGQALTVDAGSGEVVVFDRIVEQGLFEYFFSGGTTGFFLRGGKWNAPIGFEVTDPTGLWQVSKGLLFTRATPTNLTGFAFGWVGDATQVQLWLTNDWDTPATPKDASAGLRVQQSLGDVGTIGVSATYGAFIDDPARLMIDVDAALGFGDLKLGAEFNFGMQDDLSSIGFLLSGNYAFSEVVSATLRFDYLDREITDSPYKGMSITGAGIFTLVDGLDLLAEVRADMPDGGDTAVGGALELLADF